MADLRTWTDPGVADPAVAALAQAPLVHCLTNIVVAGFTANVLLAVGASPAMVENSAEAAEFARIAGAVLVNLGTLTPEREKAMRLAAGAAAQAGRPWVLDPVAVGALAHRTTLAGELLEAAPTVIRGNASEILSLAGVAGAGGRGVDSNAKVTEAQDAAHALSRTSGAVVAVSGEVDRITDGTTDVDVPGGSVLLTRVTGVGCALGGLVAAYAAVGVPPLDAAVCASALMAAAGEEAERRGPGLGSFAVALLDALGALPARAQAAASRG